MNNTDHIPSGVLKALALNLAIDFDIPAKVQIRSVASRFGVKPADINRAMDERDEVNYGGAP